MAAGNTCADRADIGVLGGSGLYSLLEGVTEVPVSTPYGDPSDPVVIGTIGDRSVAFIPRHGRDHRHPPHRINYRANLWALRALGVRQVLAPCAVGSLRTELGPGAVVIPDQLVDRTTSRVQSFFDQGACHVPFADPYCPVGRATAIEVAARAGVRPTDGGTMVVVEGPRFSTRAESRWFAAQGWSLVNMTGHPEAVLARELALCYTCIALVTDLDAGMREGLGVTQDEVFELFARHVDRLRDIVVTAASALPLERSCPCPSALDGLRPTFNLPG
jgi:5'-methylthioadenosine phosphorylase